MSNDNGTSAIQRRGLMLVLSSPSGAGKTTLTRMLLQDRDLDLTLSISVTTRTRRSSEVDGIHYRFINERQFIAMRDAGDLLEWAEVHGNFYGTPRGPVEAVLAQGRDCLFDIDYQGTQQVREKMGADTVTVFILPPSMKELRARLERRAEDSAEVIEKRLQNARREIVRPCQTNGAATVQPPGNHGCEEILLRPIIVDWIRRRSAGIGCGDPAIRPF